MLLYEPGFVIPETSLFSTDCGCVYSSHGAAVCLSYDSATLVWPLLL